ncbi:MAG: glycosyltransferase family 4 protein [Sphingomonadales bacterium]
MSKLLLITARPAGPPRSGRARLSQLHRRCLQVIAGDDLLVHELDPLPLPGRRSPLNIASGSIDGVSRAAERAIVARIEGDRVGRAFLDGSNLGRLARTIKRAAPSVELLCFCHNVEAHYYWGALKARKSTLALGVLIANFVAERMAVRFSDRLLALSPRDSEGFRRLYGRAATDLLPMAMEDQLPSDWRERRAGREGDYVLFVGDGAYANRDGMAWYVDEVAPGSPLATRIVGRGFEGLARPGVALAGSVDELADWYFGAKAAIAPLFDGSGMKTKVAEALMFGKRILGTSEAFSGYEAVAGQAGWRCDTAGEFLAALRELETMSPPRLDPALRALYETHYSYEPALARLRAILDRPVSRPLLANDGAAACQP